jgi:hypothetical protein
MKKLNIFLASLLITLFPLQVLAAVDITLKDNSTTDVMSVSVTVNTGTDTLEKIVLPIRFSDGVSITEVNTGTINCDTFDYAEVRDIVKITCELGSASEVDGVLANILFSSTETDYYFVIGEDDTDLDIGELELGNVVNVGEIEEAEEIDDEETFFEEDPLLISTQQEAEEETGFSMDKLTEYLPYVLIAGSVVLLISIVGILLSRKKESGTIPEDSTTPSPVETPSTPTEEPTLKDMVNQPEAEVVQPTPEVAQEVSMAENVSMPQTPAVPPVTEVATPPAMSSPTSESQDLQDILQSESTDMPPAPPMVEQTSPVMPTQEAPTTPEVPFTSNLDVNQPPAQAPVAQPENVIPEAPMGGPATVEDLQNSINAEIQNMGTPPVEATPLTQAPNVTAPADTTTENEDYPPVPPVM